MATGDNASDSAADIAERHPGTAGEIACYLNAQGVDIASLKRLVKPIKFAYLEEYSGVSNDGKPVSVAMLDTVNHPDAITSDFLSVRVQHTQESFTQISHTLARKNIKLEIRNGSVDTASMNTETGKAVFKSGKPEEMGMDAHANITGMREVTEDDPSFNYRLPRMINAIKECPKGGV